MKKLLAIIVVGLLFGGNANASLFGSSDIILLNKCYEISKFKNYAAYENSPKNAFEEWSLEVNLKKETITRTSIFKDFEVNIAKRKGLNIKKINIKTLPIIASTSKFVTSVDGNIEYIINIKTGELQTTFKLNNNTRIQQCSID